MEFILSKLNSLKTYSLILTFTIITLFQVNITSANTNEVKTVAIIPFETNSNNDISYITKGAWNMMNSRLSWKDNIIVLKKHELEKAMPELNLPLQGDSIIEVGQKAGIDYLITGIITDFAGSYSIDTRVYNLKEKSYLTFYDQSKSVNQIITQIDIIAAKINKKVFDRITLSYENFKKEKTISEEDLRRMNPEKMMPGIIPSQEEDKPWWKVW
jgi:TolB-like protein